MWFKKKLICSFFEHPLNILKDLTFWFNSIFFLNLTPWKALKHVILLRSHIFFCLIILCLYYCKIWTSLVITKENAASRAEKHHEDGILLVMFYKEQSYSLIINSYILSKRKEALCVPPYSWRKTEVLIWSPWSARS